MDVQEQVGWGTWLGRKRRRRRIVSFDRRELGIKFLSGRTSYDACSRWEFQMGPSRNLLPFVQNSMIDIVCFISFQSNNLYLSFYCLYFWPPLRTASVFATIKLSDCLFLFVFFRSSVCTTINNLNKLNTSSGRGTWGENWTGLKYRFARNARKGQITSDRKTYWIFLNYIRGRKKGFQ